MESPFWYLVNRGGPQGVLAWLSMLGLIVGALATIVRQLRMTRPACQPIFFGLAYAQFLYFLQSGVINGTFPSCLCMHDPFLLRMDSLTALLIETIVCLTLVTLVALVCRTHPKPSPWEACGLVAALSAVSIILIYPFLIATWS